MYAADLDGDGDADVLSASFLDNKIAWYENLGGGRFSSQQVITTAADSARSVYAADLDGDGDADVLSASSRDNKIAWYENLGGGDPDDHGDTTATATPVAVPSSTPGTLTAGDRDYFRIVLANAGTLTVYTEGGTDTYGTLTSADGNLARVSNDDGTGTNFRMMQQVEAGTYFVQVRGYNQSSTGDYTLHVAFEAASTPSVAPINVRVVQGPGLFAVTWKPVPDAAAGGSPIIRYVATATPEGGGASASCTASQSSGGCTIMGLTPGTAYDVTVQAENALGGGPVSAAVAATPTPRVFSSQQVITTAADGAASVYAADLDGDGDADVLSASFRDDKIAWYENLGGGRFSSQQVITTAADGAWSVYAADLDGDGDADVLSASDYAKIAWYENLGGGRFSAQQVITTAADGAWSVYAADLDGDGDADVLSASRYDDKIAWYENLGGGSFSSQQVITTAADEALSVYAADLDGDGDADVLSASWWNDQDCVVREPGRRQLFGAAGHHDGR